LTRSRTSIAWRDLSKRTSTNSEVAISAVCVYFFFSANGGNGLNWSDIPPELMAGVDVYKAATADLIEGGTGGQVDLRTKMPFDFHGFGAQLSGNADYADFRKKTSPTGSALLTNTWDTEHLGRIGILVDYSYGKYASRDDFIRQDPLYKTRIGDVDRYIPGVHASRKTSGDDHAEYMNAMGGGSPSDTALVGHSRGGPESPRCGYCMLRVHHPQHVFLVVILIVVIIVLFFRIIVGLVEDRSRAVDIIDGMALEFSTVATDPLLDHFQSDVCPAAVDLDAKEIGPDRQDVTPILDLHPETLGCFGRRCHGQVVGRVHSECSRLLFR